MRSALQGDSGEIVKALDRGHLGRLRSRWCSATGPASRRHCEKSWSARAGRRTCTKRRRLTACAPGSREDTGMQPLCHLAATVFQSADKAYRWRVAELTPDGKWFAIDKLQDYSAAGTSSWRGGVGLRAAVVMSSFERFQSSRSYCICRVRMICAMSPRWLPRSVTTRTVQFGPPSSGGMPINPPR